MFRAIISPICRSTRLCLQLVVHYTTSCNTQSSDFEDRQNNCPKHVELNGIINKPLLLHLVGCLYYLYQWCTIKQISDNEIYLFIKYIKSVLWIVAKRLSYIKDAPCLEVKLHLMAASPQIAHKTAICRNPHNSSNWNSHITRQSDYKYIYLFHTVPSHTISQRTHLGYRFRFDIKHRKVSSLGTMVLQEEASWWLIWSRNL